MIAWLEIHVHRAAASSITRGFQRYGFGVSLTVSCMKALTDNSTVTNDNSADHWVRRCLTPALLGEGKRATRMRSFIAEVRGMNSASRASLESESSSDRSVES